MAPPKKKKNKEINTELDALKQKGWWLPHPFSLIVDCVWTRNEFILIRS
jgi:hypothetical protein